MASTSTSSVQKSFKYDVFISFRGEDTRKSFVDHLYHALQHKSIITYKDDERIKKGSRISDELIGSIDDSRFYIIVFSKDYAASSWCLDELVKIMECQKTSDQRAYPVFYDVEPTEVRNQSGLVGKAFSKHEKDEAVGKWREALKEAADLAGWELKNTHDGHEAKFIQKIVEDISLELRFIDSSVDGKLIGMEYRVKGVVSTLETGSDDVRMIGIKGIGGGGKTTLARAIFDHISSWFEGKSFVENVREVSKASLSGLKKLQKQILSDVLNDQGIKINSVHDGKQMMKKMMCGRKVLVVLDDVDHVEQLEALAGEPSWFKEGSRIIITTRDEQVLVAHRVNLIHNVKLLSDEEAIFLFSRYTFGKAIPIQGYEELSRNVVCYAAGLPLTIRVLGSFLCGKTHLEWIDALERLKTIPLKDTLEKLELSYIGLEADYKEIFLDVACILKGWEKEKAVEALESCGFHARNGLKVLEQRSLITIYGGDLSFLGMHDHIEEMGKNIIRRLHPNEPWMHSRLWIQEEIEDISTNDSGNYDAIQCIKWDWISNETYLRGLRNMKKLRFLDIDGGIGVAIQGLPNALRYLKWTEYPYQSLIKSFQADNLVGLSIPYSNIMQFWKPGERKVLHKLRFLDMSNSDVRSFELELTPNIEMLNLASCHHLVELKMPPGCSKLKDLYLEYSGLRILNLAPTPNLETLHLEGCENLAELTMPYQCPKLKALNLQSSGLTTLNLAPTPNLETLDLGGCKDLTELTMPYQYPELKVLYLSYSGLRTLNLAPTPILETLDLRKGEDLAELTMPYQYPKLKALYLQSSGLRTLNLAPTPNLETLDLGKCEDLAELTMPYQYPELKVLYLSYSGLRTLNLAPTPNLETLDLRRCQNLVELTIPYQCLKLKALYLQFSGLRTLNLAPTLNLETLDLRQNLAELTMPYQCPKLKDLYPQVSGLETFNLVPTPNFETLDLRECEDLTEHTMPYQCPKLKFLRANSTKLMTLDLQQISNMRPFTNLESFSSSIWDLQGLKKLTLEGNIPEVPTDLDRLQSLEELRLLSTMIKHLPDSICMLKSLKHLELNSCWFIEKLPEGLGRLECLEDLNLTSCIRLQNIPKSICDMKRLKCFNLSSCLQVKKLPRELGRLECLQELNIKDTGINISDLPDDIYVLKGLHIVGSDGFSCTVEHL